MKIGDGGDVLGEIDTAQPFDPAARIAQMMQEHNAARAAAAQAPAAEEPADTPPAAEEPAAAGLVVDEGAPEIAVPADIPLPGKQRKAAAAPPPAEPTDDLGIADPPEVKRDPRAASAWAALKREVKELRGAKTQIGDLQRQLEQSRAELELARKSAGDPAEVEGLRRQLEEAESRLGQIDLTQSRAFKDRYDKPYIQKVQRLGNLLQRAGVSEDAGKAILAAVTNHGAPLAALQEAISDLPTAVQGVVLQTSQELVDVATEREQALSEWRETQAALAEQNGRAGAAETGRIASQALAKAVTALAEEDSWMFAPSEDDAWMRQRTSLVNAASHVLKTGAPEDLAKYVLEGVAATAYRKWGEQEHARAERLHAEFQRRFGKVPALGGGGGVPSAADADEVAEARRREAAEAKHKPMDPTAWLEKRMGR